MREENTEDFALQPQILLQTQAIPTSLWSTAKGYFCIGHLYEHNPHTGFYCFASKLSFYFLTLQNFTKASISSIVEWMDSGEIQNCYLFLCTHTSSGWASGLWYTPHRYFLRDMANDNTNSTLKNICSMEHCTYKYSL